MVFVNKSQVEMVDGILVAEASTLGLKPGEWPALIGVLDDHDDGFLFTRAEPLADGGYRYRSYREGTGRLDVFND